MWCLVRTNKYNHLIMTINSNAKLLLSNVHSLTRRSEGIAKDCVFSIFRLGHEFRLKLKTTYRIQRMLFNILCIFFLSFVFWFDVRFEVVKYFFVYFFVCSFIAQSNFNVFFFLIVNASSMDLINLNSALNRWSDAILINRILWMQISLRTHCFVV